MVPLCCSRTYQYIEAYNSFFDPTKNSMRSPTVFRQHLILGACIVHDRAMLYMYIYIYIYRERYMYTYTYIYIERERYLNNKLIINIHYTHIQYIYIYIVLSLFAFVQRDLGAFARNPRLRKLRPPAPPSCSQNKGFPFITMIVIII